MFEEMMRIKMEEAERFRTARKQFEELLGKRNKRSNTFHSLDNMRGCEARVDVEVYNRSTSNDGKRRGGGGGGVSKWAALASMRGGGSYSYNGVSSYNDACDLSEAYLSLDRPRISSESDRNASDACGDESTLNLNMSMSDDEDCDGGLASKEFSKPYDDRDKDDVSDVDNKFFDSETLKNNDLKKHAEYVAVDRDKRAHDSDKDTGMNLDEYAEFVASWFKDINRVNDIFFEKQHQHKSMELNYQSYATTFVISVFTDVIREMRWRRRDNVECGLDLLSSNIAESILKESEDEMRKKFLIRDLKIGTSEANSVVESRKGKEEEEQADKLLQVLLYWGVISSHHSQTSLVCCLHENKKLQRKVFLYILKSHIHT